MSQAKCVIYLHIPKAGGTTINRIIENESKNINHFHFDGGNPKKSWDDFINLSEPVRKKIQYVTGHMQYGIHDFIPQNSSYFTILRDPVKRFISFYNYILMNKKHYLHKYVVDNKLSLDEFLHSRISKENENCIVRNLLKYEENEVQECGQSEYLIALERLKRFTVVGITEKFDETLVLLRNAYNWASPYYYKRNISRKTVKYSDISSKTIDNIKELNKYDYKLYRYACDRFESEVVAGGNMFDEKLNEFQAKNKIYGGLIFSTRIFWNRVKAK